MLLICLQTPPSPSLAFPTSVDVLHATLGKKGRLRLAPAVRAAVLCCCSSGVGSRSKCIATKLYAALRTAVAAEAAHALAASHDVVVIIAVQREARTT